MLMEKSVSLKFIQWEGKNRGTRHRKKHTYTPNNNKDSILFGLIYLISSACFYAWTESIIDLMFVLCFLVMLCPSKFYYLFQVKKKRNAKFSSFYPNTHTRTSARTSTYKTTDRKKPLNRQNVKQQHNICFPLDNIVFVEYCCSHQQIDVKCFQAHLFKH